VEEDLPAPQSVYALHKAATERAFEAFPEHLILRVAWLFGKGAPTFMSQMPRLLMLDETLTVASGKKGSCLYAGYGAQLALSLIDAGASGVVNTVHSGETAWEVFAEECLRQLKARGLKPRCKRIEKVPFDQMSIMKPGRPPFSVLSNDKLSRITGIRSISWQEGLDQYLNALFAGNGSWRKESAQPRE
jgi:dTDP-4-dehydrorhamnose reductase